MEQTTNNKKYKYYEIKVSIKNTHPPVWRRLQIPAGITFHELSAIIQLAFDWGGYHLYSFEINEPIYGGRIFIELLNEDKGVGYYGKINAKKEKIDKYFNTYPKIEYTYDFGDNWVHNITVEKIVETDTKLTNPICIKAKMASLPEDCGGPWGYQRMLNTLANENNEDYQETKDWVENESFMWIDDRKYVDIEMINNRLADYKEHAEFLDNTNW